VSSQSGPESDPQREPRHRTIICVDVERFGDPQRIDPDRVEVRDRLYEALRHAFARSGVSWENCDHEDRGDGVLMIVEPNVPKPRLVVRFPRALGEALDRHNRSVPPATRIRLRVAVHAGDVRFDDHGVVGQEVNFAFRLVNAEAPRSALRESPGNLVLIVSDYIFDKVVRQDRAGDPAAYRPVRIAEKETETTAWISRPDHPFAPGDGFSLVRDDRRDPQQAFERRYLDYIARTLGRFELFGVTRGRASRGHLYADAYVRLAVARANHQDDTDDEGLTGAGLDAAGAIGETRRVVLRGGAGAGKTTLLRQLAAAIAGGEEDSATSRWRDTIPFFLPLRLLAGADPPPPGELLQMTATVMAEEAPPGWVAEQFRTGRALLLVDGVDELVAARRAAVREWLEQLVSLYPQARYVVTTRPFAVPEDWLSAAEFVRYDLLPMSVKGTRDFVSRWHAAARAEHKSDEGMQRWLTDCERRLTDLLSARRELRQLATSPLLCGLLCALHREENMHLPQDRKSLYDKALHLLLVRWDEERSVRLGEEPSLSNEEQLVLLQRFAYSFVKNQLVLLDRAEATRRIEHAMRGLRSHDADPTHVLQRTLERTGLLTEPYQDQIQFVHRTFRDYLAAKEIVDAGDLRLLIEHAHQDHWHDVVVMAVLHARPMERDQLLQGLLHGNEEAQHDPRVRDRLHLVAAACLEQAHVVNTHEVRVEVQQAAARLIPPRSPEEAELLARAGPFVLELLPGPEGLSDAEAARVVRTAALIGGELAREKIAMFTTIDESVVIEELLRAWRLSEDPEDYARTVLADVDFGDRMLDVRSRYRTEHLKYLKRLTNVVFRGDLTPLDPIAAIPNLRQLSLMWNDVVRDLSPLVKCQSLRELALTRCPYVRDLTPLARMPLEELDLHFMQADLGTLSGAGIHRLSVRDDALAHGLYPLPAGLPLRELTVDNWPEDRDLRGIERWPTLERISVVGIPRAEELQVIAELPDLRHLVVRLPEAPDDLARLRALPSLRLLDLTDVDIPAHSAMRAAGHRWLPGVVIRINGR
jgi:hypothetical protein